MKVYIQAVAQDVHLNKQDVLIEVEVVTVERVPVDPKHQSEEVKVTLGLIAGRMASGRLEST